MITAMIAKIFIGVSLVLFLAVVPTVAAQSPAPSAKKQLEERRQELQRRVATKQAERKEDRAIRIKAHFERMLTRSKAAQERYTNFLTRVASRKEKLAAEGKDTAKLETLIATARGNQVKVTALIEKLETDLKTLDTSATPKTVVSTLKEDMAAVKRSLQQLHASMKLVVQELKKQGGTGSGRATGSATVK